MGNMISKLNAVRLGGVVFLIAAADLALHLYADRYYGYFIDELYNLALGRHLAWGYVDVAPMIAVIARFEMAVFGDSLQAIRLLPAVAGAAKVLLTAAIARELGGGRFAQGLAALCFLVAPGFLALDHFLNVNSFEGMVWIGLAWLLVRLIRTGDEKLWLWFGLLSGIGVETKHSVLLFGFALVAGFALTPARRYLANRWLLIGGRHRHCAVPSQPVVEHPAPLPVRRVAGEYSPRRPQRQFESAPVLWRRSAGDAAGEPAGVAGRPLVLSFSPRRAAVRSARLGFLIASVLVLVMNPRTYYLFPAFPMLFAAGSVAIERWRVRWVRPVLCALLVGMGALLAPTMLPLLPPETYIRYAHATGLEQPRIENHQLGPLPQLFADQFGWEEMAAATARVYWSLPAGRRARGPRSSARTTDRPAPSTCSGADTACPRPSADTRIITFGDRAATPARA